jgi:hypothetical protein
MLMMSLDKVKRKKRRKMYDEARKFQDVWTTQLPWAKLVFDEQGQGHQVCCTILYMRRMSVVTLLLIGCLSWIACKPMSLLSNNINMCNSLLFFICFPMVIPRMIIRA